MGKNPFQPINNMTNANGSSNQALPEEVATPNAEVSSVHHRFKLQSDMLVKGMFVAELDRPWLDTPFLIQGFLIDSDIEIETLRKHTSFVFIDLIKSLPESLAMISTQEELSAPEDDEEYFGPATEPISYEREAQKHQDAKRAPRVYKVRNDVRVSSSTRMRFKQFIKASAEGDAILSASEDSPLGRALDWLKTAFGGDGASANGKGNQKLNGELARKPVADWIPSEIRVKPYNDNAPLEQVLPMARVSISKAEGAFKQVQVDIKGGKPIKLAQVHEAVEDMVGAVIDNPDALMWVARLRAEDVNTYNHAVRVALYMVALGRHLGFPKAELMTLGMIGMLADVGKTKIPKALLDKPGMLSPKEFSIIKEHVRLSVSILKHSMKLPLTVELGISQHHERIDGTGYPAGLKAEQISIYGRMAAIADCFTALISPRSYANPSPPQEALMSLYEWAGTSFHEPLVEQFVQAVGVFPVGSLVEISTGEIAVVVAHNRVRRLEPRVLILTWPDKTPLAKPLERDLFVLKQEPQHKAIRIIRGLASGSYGLKLRDYYLEEVAKSNELTK